MKFLFGLAVGVVVGLLYAPAPGEETREKLYEKAGDYARVPQEKLADLAQDKKEKVAQMGERLGREAAESAVDSVSEKLRNNERTA